jgi:hypothetical protein
MHFYLRRKNEENFETSYIIKIYDRMQGNLVSL